MPYGKYKMGKMDPGQGEPGTRRGGPDEPSKPVRQRPKPGEPGWVTIMPVKPKDPRKRKEKPIDYLESWRKINFPKG
jgi:hypothetical protein